ncbi:MAG: cell division protein FtsA [Alistipes ihumii]|uniref:cell division protein FtsA n=1 Tax=Alistipes ihumii TaxID=1470347 RepID=UPI00265E1624|nr:cell division protein FtsA [Alistipes ihumii]
MENRVENGDYVVAIDLGTNTVVTVVGTKDEDGRIRIVDREVAPVQGMGMVRGEIKNIELVSQSIKATVAAIEQRQQIRITEAYAGVSGQHIRCVKHPYHVFSRGGEIRQEDVQHLHDSMRNVPAPEGEKILQIIPQSYVVDDEEETSSPVGTFGTKLASTFNILLGDSTAISRVEMALKRGGVAPLGLFLNAVASAEAVLSEDEKQEGVAVIDIGGGTTDVTVYEKNIIRHVGIVPMGGNVVNKDIRSYGILEKHVESLKTRYGGAMREKAQPDKFITTPGLSAKAPKEISCQNLAAIIEARMQDIIDFAIEEIKKSGYQNKLSAGVVLTGGGAQLRDLDALFKSYTGMDVRVAGPEAVLAADSPDEATGPDMSTAVGILAKAFAEGRPSRAARPRTTSARPVSGSYDAAEPKVGVSRQKINDLYRNDAGASRYGQSGLGESVAEEEEEFEPKKAKKQKGSRGPGFFSKIKEKMINMFDEEIDDNEI